MDPETRQLLEQLTISFALGGLVGLQRQHAESVLAGLRTFPLISVLGTVVAWIDQQQEANGWILAASFFGVSLIVAITNAMRRRREKDDIGLTTAAALMMMFAIGAYLVGGERVLAVIVGSGVAVLLQFKPELHGFVEKLGDTDLRAIMTFALITCIVLPVLPNHTYELVSPLNVLNPFEIWLMVVLIVGISLGGYLIYKFFGKTAGILLGGILGGAISSTATTVSFSKRSAQMPESSRIAALIILIASTVVYVRVMIEIAVVAPGSFMRLSLPALCLLAGNGVTALVMWLTVRKAREQMPEQKNPTEIKAALLFAGLYMFVLMALDAAKTYVGSEALYVIAFLSGLTDMDAITLSAARMVQRSDSEHAISAVTGSHLILIAALSNLLFKAGLASTLGSPRLRNTVIVLFAISAAIGLVLYAIVSSMSGLAGLSEVSPTSD